MKCICLIVAQISVITDKLTSALSRRSAAYSDVCWSFDFLAKLENLNKQELQQAAEQYKGLDRLLADKPTMALFLVPDESQQVSTA